MSARRPRQGDFAGHQGGATAVEFALILPVLAAFLFGGFQLAWAMHCASSVRWSLESSARAIMLNPAMTAADIQSAMVSKLAGLADSTNLTVSVVTDTSNPASKVIRASSVYQHSLAIPFVSASRLTFSATTSVPAP